MSFLFQCCKAKPKKEVYELRMKQQEGKQKLHYTSDLTKEELKKVEPNMTSAVKIRVGEYQALTKKYSGNEMFTDGSFPPNMQSIGNIPGLPEGTHWKRIFQIVKDPQMIVDGIQPTDIVQKRLNKCYFLSTVATLAQKNQRIQIIFADQMFNPNGLYKVKLRVNGFIREVIVDDYVPVDEDNQPLFCQPNQSQIWVMILEKAWAKLKGSYENISYGNPTQVFKAVTYSPAQLFAISQNSHAGDRIWDDLQECLGQKKPVCAGTKSLKDIPEGTADNGIVWDHYYTIIDAVTLKDVHNEFHRVMKLRNPWGKVQWQGQYAEGDTNFWDKIPNSPAKMRIVGKDEVKQEDDGVFFMGYQDFCKNFQSLHICHMVDRPFYEITRVFFDGKHGQIYLLTVKQEGEYIIELHQSQDKYNPKTGQKIIYQGESINRATIIAMKPNKYEFIDGAFTFDEYDTTLRLKLFPGKHLLYIKIDPNSEGHLPFKTSLSCYSESLVTLKKLNKEKLGNFYVQMFSQYANHNKKRTFNNEKMWMTWKQFYQRGGLAFVAFGNDIISDKKFIVSFLEKDFDDMNYVLKKPYKGKGQVSIQIEPGEEKIIVARVKKGPPQQMKFPPNMNVRIQKI